MHGAYKHFYDNLSWFCEISEFICHREIDWDKLIQRARTLGVKRAVLLGSYLAYRLLEIKLPQHILHAAEGDRTLIAMSKSMEIQLFKEPPGVPGIMSKALFHIRIMDRFSQRLHYCTELVVSPSIYDRTWVRLPRGLRFLYYVLRPFRLLFKGLGHLCKELRLKTR
jgi:hypothetical protein